MSKSPRIAVVLAGWERTDFLPPDLESELSSISSDLHFLDPETLDGEDAWVNWLEKTAPEILVSAWMTPRLPDDLPERIPSLKYVCHLVGSVKGLVPDSLIEDGLLVTNWGRSVSRTIAESALMMAIAALRRVSHWAHQMHHENGWKERTAMLTGSLFERKVGLHGFGAISQELTRLLQPFDVEITTYSPSVPDNLLEEFGVRRADSLEELFSKNDVIIELAALTPKNTGIVTEALLRSIPAGGAFVNVGRGAVVDEAALVRVARDGHIQVALDVYTQEPLPEESPLRGMTNVLLLPHLGGPTTDRRRDATSLGIANIRRYLKGEDLESRISLSVYKRIT
jgi:phosphoglycerate dehydrogenase-like enzyme